MKTPLVHHSATGIDAVGAQFCFKAKLTSYVEILKAVKLCVVE